MTIHQYKGNTLIKHIINRLFSLPSLIYGFIKSLSSVNGVTAQGMEVRSPLEHNSKERLNELYSDPEIIKDYIDDARIAFYKDLIQFALQKGISFHQKKVADIGCGTGHLLKFIGEKNEVTSLTGFEFSVAVLAVAKTVCPQASFYEYDVYHEPVHAFDVVFCTEVLEHLQYPDKALKNCLKMLANNGVLIVTVPDGRKDTFLGHINFWSPESWDVYIKANCDGYEYDIGTMQSECNYAIIKRNERNYSHHQDGQSTRF